MNPSKNYAYSLEQLPIGKVVALMVDLTWCEFEGKENLEKLNNVWVWGIVRKHEKDRFVIIQDQYNNLRLHMLPCGISIERGIHEGRLNPTREPSPDFFYVPDNHVF